MAVRCRGGVGRDTKKDDDVSVESSSGTADTVFDTSLEPNAKFAMTTKVYIFPVVRLFTT